MGAIFHEGEEYAGVMLPRVTWEANGILGAKNLLPNKAVTVTRNGITFTVNADKSVTISGTATGNAYLSGSWQVNANNGSFVPQIGKSYKFTVNATMPSGSRIYINNVNGINEWKDAPYDFTASTNDYIVWDIYVSSGTAFTTPITVYPMVRLADDIDGTYFPFAATNKELTDGKADNSVIAPVERGATASRAYAIGEHFIRDGAFCTAKTAIASGATLTLNTNYTAGSIGEFFSYIEQNYVPILARKKALGLTGQHWYKLFSIIRTSHQYNYLCVHFKVKIGYYGWYDAYVCIRDTPSGFNQSESRITVFGSWNASSIYIKMYLQDNNTVSIAIVCAGSGTDHEYKILDISSESNSMSIGGILNVYDFTDIGTTAPTEWATHKFYL